jgi:biotin operon repressor
MSTAQVVYQQVIQGDAPASAVAAKLGISVEAVEKIATILRAEGAYGE